jgi:AraC family transcriptional regulator
MSAHAQISPTIMQRPVAPQLPHHPVPSPHRTSAAIARLLATATRMLEADRLTAKTCIQRAAELLGVDLNQAAEPAPRSTFAKGGLAPWQAADVRSYIEDHLSSSLRITALARMARLSTSHFFRAFRRSFGETPGAYILKRRMLRGQHLMLNSRQSLTQIALEIGMCDQAHFCRTFRRAVGTNPAAWRRQLLLTQSDSPATPERS